MFDEMKRWLLLLPEALVFGLSFAKFKFRLPRRACPSRELLLAPLGASRPMHTSE